MQLLFASANAHKVQEISILLPSHICLLGLNDAGITNDIPETGKTLQENALLKARFAQEVLRKQGNDWPVFADDSGLEVAALNGAPGVYSARYAGEPKNDANNNQKLLQALSKVTKREARFVTVIAFIFNNKEMLFEGEVKGTIAYAARGEHGFGYDPLFIPRGYRSTFAELGPEIKKQISHRAVAVQKLFEHLRELVP